MTAIDLTVLGTEPAKDGKGGKGGVFQITNADFVAAVFPSIPEGGFAAVCSKSGDPGSGGWLASGADQGADKMAATNNNYLSCSSFYPGDDGSFKARKAQFAACHFLMLDDITTKVPLERLADFKLSWLIETSPGNFQGAEALFMGRGLEELYQPIVEATPDILVRWGGIRYALEEAAKTSSRMKNNPRQGGNHG
jgi:hypothetical protein